MSAPLLKQKVIVRVGENHLMRCEVYAKSHKSFFLKDDIRDTVVNEYLFTEENDKWFKDISTAKKIIRHPIIQLDKDVYEIQENYEL